MSASVPFVDLLRLHEPLSAEFDAAWKRVLASGRFHLGPETSGLEAELAAHEGAQYGVCCGSGSDALYLALRSLDIGPGDAVATLSNSFMATAESIARTGATVLFVEPDPVTRSMDAEDLRRLLEEPAGEALKAVIPIHLFGRRSDLASLRAALADAGRDEVELVIDAAQCHGSPGVASETRLTCYSFYPAKNLGALGDGGMVLTNDEGLAARIRGLRNHGRVGKHEVGEVGINSRFDEIQAAVLRIKLVHLRTWNSQRQQIAATYREGFANVGGLTVPPDGAGHVYHLFVVEVEAAWRDAFVAGMKARAIGVGLHYPVACHQMAPYPSSRPLPVTERLVSRVVSLPIFPGMRTDEVDTTIAAVKDVLSELNA
jgi:dTDP-3-amino-3,4,6-trideoxy-alpha-D-glucose transaminase